MKVVINDGKRSFLDNVKLTKDEKIFIEENIVSFLGVEKIFRGETNFDQNQIKLLMQEYLFYKNFFIRKKVKSLEEDINRYNKVVDMAMQLGIMKTFNDIPLKKISIEVIEC